MTDDWPPPDLGYAVTGLYWDGLYLCAGRLTLGYVIPSRDPARPGYMTYSDHFHARWVGAVFMTEDAARSHLLRIGRDLLGRGTRAALDTGRGLVMPAIGVATNGSHP